MHFPDSDAQWKGVASRQFVTATLQLLARRGWRVVNADLTLLAQAPRIAPLRAEIRRNVAQLLALPEDAVNLKATTPEFLGFVGREEGLVGMATVLLEGGPTPGPAT
jgi:2-C-methyl-D-erythritol 2,4-cyclodiphosphate synthase